MSEITVSGFDYHALGEVDASFVREATARLRLRLERTGRDIVEIGTDLIAVKERLAHGSFGPWLKAEFCMTSKTAQRFMRAAEQFDFKNDTVSHLEDNYSPTAMYELFEADPETTDKAMEQAKNGKVTGADVRKLKEENKKLKEQRDDARRERAAKETYIQQLSDRISQASNEIICLEDEIKRFKEIDPKGAMAVGGAGLSGQQDESLKRILCMAWEGASPALRGWFLDEFAG